MKTLVIRTDALAATGAGHLGRCLALGAAARGGGWRVEGVGRIADDRLREGARRTIDAWHELPDGAGLKEVLAAMRALQPDWVALDGYAFGVDDQRALGGLAKLLVLDDGPRLPAYHADLLLDQNPGAEARGYVLEGHGRALLGGRYTLLRPEFLAWRDHAHPQPERAGRLLLSLGAVVEAAALRAVMAGLARVEAPLRITCLTGTDPVGLDLTRALAPRQHHLEALPWHEDMPALMAASDLALAAAGSTAWELAFMAVPGLYLTLADNQAGVAAAMGRAGAGIDLGRCDAGLPDRLVTEVAALIDARGRRESLARAGRALIDGRGAQRVLEAMT